MFFTKHFIYIYIYNRIGFLKRSAVKHGAF